MTPKQMLFFAIAVTLAFLVALRIGSGHWLWQDAPQPPVVVNPGTPAITCLSDTEIRNLGEIILVGANGEYQIRFFGVWQVPTGYKLDTGNNDFWGESANGLVATLWPPISCR